MPIGLAQAAYVPVHAVWPPRPSAARCMFSSGALFRVPCLDLVCLSKFCLTVRVYGKDEQYQRADNQCQRYRGGQSRHCRLPPAPPPQPRGLSYRPGNDRLAMQKMPQLRGHFCSRLISLRRRLSRHFRQIVSRSRGICICNFRGLGGSSCKICTIIIRWLPRKGSSPVKSSNRMIQGNKRRCGGRPCGPRRGLAPATYKPVCPGPDRPWSS